MGMETGIVGLGVMGESIALDIERHGFSVAVYNRSYDRTEAFLHGPAEGKRIMGFRSLTDFVAALDRPRKVLLLVTAGPPVDRLLEKLRPLLEAGDIVIDGGNSHFADTDRRIATYSPTGIFFVGMGISGREEGPHTGLSLMPGGDQTAYDLLYPILSRIAAQTEAGPCVTHVGAGSAGHFVKMAHNGIEYADMQLLCEAYDFLRQGLGLRPPEIRQVLAQWTAGELRSFLLEVTERVVDFPDDLGSGDPLIDRILDHAGQKGTGKWTTQAALDLGVPIPTITAAVDARLMSSRKEERVAAARLFRETPGRITADRREVIEQLRAALFAAKICAYAQGFALMAQASADLGYGLDLAEVARIWRAGCVIRAALLDDVREAFLQEPRLPNLLVDPELHHCVTCRIADWRSTVELGVRLGLPLPAMSASLAYFDSYRRERLPASLIQAQRDFFGAHGYERTDRSGVYHTDWKARG
jgi:6-phosphogluconate dehydrogenase